jgi:hypothetical protein
MLTVIDFYAENPIVGKTLQQCIIESSYHNETNTYKEINGIQSYPLEISAFSNENISINGFVTYINADDIIYNISEGYRIDSKGYNFYAQDVNTRYTVTSPNIDLYSPYVEIAQIGYVGSTYIKHNKTYIGYPQDGWDTGLPMDGLFNVLPTNRLNSAHLEIKNPTLNTLTLSFENGGDTANVEFLYGGNLYLQNVSKVKITGGSNGQVLTTDGSGNLSWTTPSSGGLTASSFVFNEVPSPTAIVNNFTIAFTPVANTVQVFINGLLQKPTTDYTVSGTTITFINFPLLTDEILCHYIKA